MASARPLDGSASRRRLPTQRRSRERVERILDVTADLIAELGVSEPTTQAIAARAGIPVASLYRYFADKDEIVLALAERHVADMERRINKALGELEILSVRTVLEATMRAFVSGFHHRPGFVVLWWHDRTNAAVIRYIRRHNKRLAADLFAFATGTGLLRPDTDPIVAELGVEVGDRIFQLAFEQGLSWDKRLVDEGVELVIAYFERYATPAGRDGRRP